MFDHSLWQSIVSASRRALASGALVPIPTDYTFIEDGGVRFFVRIVSGLRRKDDAKKKEMDEAASGKKPNPFLPPEKDLVIADISRTHLAILNKFNVTDHHVLIITRQFEDQEMLLTPSDFEALWACMQEYEGLGFYNGGVEAGASQQHKHLQLVPLPLAPEGPPIPIAPLLMNAPRTGICRVTGLSFPHAFSYLPGEQGSHASVQVLFALYGRLLRDVGMTAPSGPEPVRQSQPYCLLVTNEWMLVVPRIQEHFEDISLNSLAFAGSLFLRDEKQLERLRSFGVMNALVSVSS